MYLFSFPDLESHNDKDWFLLFFHFGSSNLRDGTDLNTLPTLPPASVSNT